MADWNASIPRPLVRANQWVIVLAVVWTWTTGVYWILAVPLLAGAMGFFFDFNPVMRLAKLFLRKPPSGYVPEDKASQRFNQLLAVGFLLLALLGYAFEWRTMAYVFSAMVALAALVAIMGFCVGCFIRYQWMQYRRKHS
ncbi:DUF4395 domain-containing protein [Paenibacillus flagellatus]|uniref:DUF4395 domain-containing protein n=1 Tax=Paenibacillus flagellatus TaxID=2211139 RepID=A0A2V5JZC4_9BACL|nr:DUF4395 domain-containing protein [Paenibacillus flagellatus]PYI50543.1 DUF4395 domain-containing protein [Paenibacillus flagellatus]